ncbi:MAG: zinc carboxypeptidase [Acidobacteria bacterium]|nr:zinc carboxypeptidase [Acidobacteriota bacterium]
MKTRKLFLIIIISLAVSSILIAEVRYDIKGNSIISMTVEDYGIYLQDNPPLDRLYVKDGRIFLLVNPLEIQKVNEAAITYEFNALPPDRTFAPKSGINGDYHTYRETVDLLEELETQYPNLCRVESIGQTIEGREIYVIRISLQDNTTETKPSVFICGCHHAREWISVEVPLLFAQYLVQNYSTNAEIQHILQNAEINIVPIVNPDGLEYSIRTYRFWRKNRRFTEYYSWGVDINRNYTYQWGYDDVGSSPNPYSSVYRGISGSSEPETTAIINFITNNPPEGSISYHNYSQVILIPWGYTYESTPPHYSTLKSIAREMATKMEMVNGTQYSFGNGSEELGYTVNGSMEDWVYGVFKIPAFTIELPPDNYLLGGFVTDEAAIQSAFTENVPGLLYFINWCLDYDLN